MQLMILAWAVDFHWLHSERNRISQTSPRGMTCIVAMPSTLRCNSSSNFLAVSSLVTPKSRFRNSSFATLIDIVSVIIIPLMTLMILVLAILSSGAYCLSLGTVSQGVQPCKFSFGYL